MPLVTQRWQKLTLVVAATLGLSFGSFDTARALECNYCEGKDLTELVRHSVYLESPSLRAQIRGWLAEKHPETAPGYFGRAWIAAANGAEPDEVVRLYREAIKRDPTLSTSYVNAGFEYDSNDRDDEAIVVWREGIPHEYDDPIFVSNIYFTLKNGLKDEQAADVFLREAEANQYIAPWGFDYIRGTVAQRAGDRDEADRYYLSALERGGPFEALDEWLRNRLALLAARRAGQEERIQALVTALEWGRNNDSAPAVALVAKKLAEDFEYYEDAFGLFRESFYMNPTPEAAASGFGSIGNSDFSAGMELLETALQYFPYNHEVLQTLIWANTDFQLNEDEVRYFGPVAIDNSPRNSDKLDSIKGYVRFLEEVADYQTPVPIYEKYLPLMSGRDYNNLLGDYIDNRINAGELVHAARLLDQARTRKKFSASWITVREKRIAEGLRLANQRERFLDENPFLVDWEDRFGDSLRVAVEFATGRADIRPEGFPLLDQAARTLRAQGAEDYVFLIEGHTDATGTDAVNLPLSKARAEAVKTYLVETLGLETSRVQTVGYGPRIPLATNETDQGRQTNRRVEIRPYGNIAAPRIATNGWMDTNGFQLSRDGRIAVSGASPIQVWDLERMLRLHQLPIGSTTNAMSPNGRYLAARSSFTDKTGATTRMMYIYDLRTGLMRAQLPVRDYIDEISWSPFSDAVAWTDRNGFLRIYDVNEMAYRATTKMATIRGSEVMLWLHSGDRIVAKAPRGAPMRIFDAQTLEVVDQIPNPGWLHDLTQTSDGKYAVGITNDYELLVWDTATWQEIRRQRMPLSGFDLTPHPTKPLVMITDGFDNDIKRALVDVTTGQIVASNRENANLVGSFTPDGAYYVTASAGSVDYYDTETLQLSRSVSAQSTRGHDLKVVEASDVVVSRDSAGSAVWSLKTGRRVHQIDTSTVSGWRPLSRDGTVLVSADQNGRLVTFDTRSFVESVAVDTGIPITTMSASDNYVAVASETVGEAPDQNPQTEIVVYERDTLAEVMRTRFDLVTEPRRFDKVYGAKPFLSVADNGLVAVTSSWVDGYRQGTTMSRVVTIYDAKTGSEIKTFRAEGRFSNMRWDEGGEEFWYADGNRWYVHDPYSARVLRRETPKAAYDIDLSDGRTLRWFWDHISLDGQEVVFPYTLRDLEVHEERNIAVGQTTGNELVFVDLVNMTHVLTVAAGRDGEWIAYSPDGAYSASLNGTEGVYWSLGDNYVPFSALADRFERPGLIRNLLDAVARGETRPDVKPDVEADVFDAPYTVNLKSAAQVSTEDETYLLELQVEKSSADLPDPEIEYTLNGRRVLKSRGFEEEAVFEGNETLGITRRFDLNPGENVIEASLVWRDARIQTQRVVVVREGGRETVDQVSGQTLWFFGVGVSDYERSSQNLNFAHRDAEELARLMKAQEGGLFDQVNTRIITNQDATERNVRVQMNEFLDQADPDDVIVLFLAGHGVTDEEQELFFITHDADLKKPYTGMSVDRFRNFLENRPLNQNALLLLDICHSGAVEGRVVADDAVQSLSKGTGAVVFASSSGSEQSFEDESFGGGHGAFTAALLEGLRGLADIKAGNRDGLNSLREMVLFTSTRVPEMTEGRQQPAIPALALSVDYPISRATN